VLDAAREQTTGGQVALEQLCRAYWYPLYAYVRRRGYNADEATDLTQEFFARLLAKQRLREASPERGRFRSFLLTAMKHFLADEWEAARAQKRGGKTEIISLDEGEARYEEEGPSAVPEETYFDERWARTILERALLALKEEFYRAGKGLWFAQVKRFLTEHATEADYAAVAEKLNMKPGAISVAVHRFRQRYRELVRAEIAETVASPVDIEDEMRYLLAVVTR
jgi:RNA polymerase sigma-70 factor (ECF subfamily)